MYYDYNYTNSTNFTNSTNHTFNFWPGTDFDRDEIFKIDILLDEDAAEDLERRINNRTEEFHEGCQEALGNLVGTIEGAYKEFEEQLYNQLERHQEFASTVITDVVDFALDHVWFNNIPLKDLFPELSYYMYANYDKSATTVMTRFGLDKLKVQPVVKQAKHGRQKGKVLKRGMTLAVNGKQFSRIAMWDENEYTYEPWNGQWDFDWENFDWNDYEQWEKEYIRRTWVEDEFYYDQPWEDSYFDWNDYDAYRRWEKGYWYNKDGAWDEVEAPDYAPNWEPFDFENREGWEDWDGFYGKDAVTITGFVDLELIDEWIQERGEAYVEMIQWAAGEFRTVAAH